MAIVNHGGGGLCATPQHHAYRLAGNFSVEEQFELDPPSGMVRVLRSTTKCGNFSLSPTFNSGLPIKGQRRRCAKVVQTSAQALSTTRLFTQPTRFELRFSCGPPTLAGNLLEGGRTFAKSPSLCLQACEATSATLP